MIYVILYLGAIVAANLLVATFGPAISIVDAFIFIGLNLVARDKLHDAWHHRHLVPKMAALILTGSVLSWLLNHGAGRIALASCLAFGAAELTDAVLYARLVRRPWLQRSNGSNLGSALVDSIVFPTIAFGGFSMLITLGQFAAKVLGGFLWSLLLRRRAAPVVAVLALLLLPRVGQAQAPKAVIQLQAGPNLYEFKDYRPTWNAGVNSIIFLPKKFSVLLVLSRDFEKDAKPVGIIALQWRVLSIR